MDQTTAAPTTSPLDTDQLLSLAPTALESYRRSRYQGTEMSVSLADFPPDARQRVEAAYEAILGLQLQLQPVYADAEAGVEVLEAYVDRAEWKAPFAQLARMSVPDDQGKNAQLRRVAHDIKGGALSALYGELQIIAHGGARPEDAQQAYFLARDHTKIMRNGLPDLDAERYARDLHYKLHDVELIAQKWRGTQVREDATEVKIRADIDFRGAIATRCMEFSALDRVLYNLLNNAVRHTSGRAVHLRALAVPPGAPTSLRFVVANAIDPTQRDDLAERTDGAPSRLFDPGVSTASTGLGLAICSEFVARAYGLDDGRQAVEQRYLGASFVDDQFACWFHWPLVDD